MSTFGGSEGPQVPGAADADGGVRAIHIDDLPAMEQGEGTMWRPIRRTLELTGVSANAYTGVEAGDEVIEPHDERSQSAAGHEELYFVAAGRATFIVDGAEVNAPAGTLIAIDVGRGARRGGRDDRARLRRRARLRPPSRRLRVRLRGSALLHRGRLRGRDRDPLRGPRPPPAHPGLNYHLACYNALAGRGDDAIEYLVVALENSDGRVKGWAAEDEDLDSIRDRKDWPL